MNNVVTSKRGDFENKPGADPAAGVAGGEQSALFCIRLRAYRWDFSIRQNYFRIPKRRW